MKWRFLIIEDNSDIARQLKEAVPSFVESPDTAEAVDVNTFSDAEKRMLVERYDLLILDLKDSSDSTPEADSEPAGVKIFESLKKTKFVPVIFYTAYAHKVRDLETSFIRVVEKTKGIEKVRDEVKRIMQTRLPSLARRLEDVQRDYMWEFVSLHWKEFKSPHEQGDLAYLLARRLALSMEALAKELSTSVQGIAGASFGDGESHPMAMYISPPIGQQRQAGDILLDEKDGSGSYWVVLTPSCDFVQKKVRHVVLAKCDKLIDQKEYKDWVASDSATKSSHLESLIGDNRQSKDEIGNLQPERFKFLPGTFFIPDLLIDFQQVKSVAIASLEAMKPIASLDSPYAEALLARFARYYGRLGTPDINKSIVIDRLAKSIARPQVEPVIPKKSSRSRSS